MLENEPGVSGLDWFHGAVRGAAVARPSSPITAWKVGVTDTDPGWIAAPGRPSPSSAATPAPRTAGRLSATPFAAALCYFDANLRRYIPKYGPRDSVGEVFSYSTTAESLGSIFGPRLRRRRPARTARQTYEFVFGSAGYRELGYGLSSTVIHELGHHIGMSPSRTTAFDSESGADYDAAGETYFAWLGDEADTVMHPPSPSPTASAATTRDNMYRWETAGYLNWANAVAGDLPASPEAPRGDDRPPARRPQGAAGPGRLRGLETSRWARPARVRPTSRWNRPRTASASFRRP